MLKTCKGSWHHWYTWSLKLYPMYQNQKHIKIELIGQCSQPCILVAIRSMHLDQIQQVRLCTYPEVIYLRL